MATEKKFFRVEGEAVHLVSERIERTVRLSDLLEEAGRARGITTPVLPQGCRFYSRQGDREVFVVEQPPTTRKLVWRYVGEGEKWTLAFPYVIFVVVFQGTAVSTGECRIFYRTAPMSDLSDTVQKTNLCNVYSNGGICTGAMRVNGETLAQKAESFCSGFWKSEFNSDLESDCFRPAASRFPQVASLENWQEETAKNQLFPLGISWFEHGRLTDVIERRL